MPSSIVPDYCGCTCPPWVRTRLNHSRVVFLERIQKPKSELFSHPGGEIWWHCLTTRARGWEEYVYYLQEFWSFCGSICFKVGECGRPQHTDCLQITHYNKSQNNTHDFQQTICLDYNKPQYNTLQQWNKSPETTETVFLWERLCITYAYVCLIHRWSSGGVYRYNWGYEQGQSLFCRQDVKPSWVFPLGLKTQ